MRITHIETKTEESTVLDDILCNRCGGSCKTEIGNYEGLVETVIQGGDDSKLGDMVRFTFSICEPCLKEIFATFKHPPEVNDLMGEGHVLE